MCSRVMRSFGLVLFTVALVLLGVGCGSGDPPGPPVGQAEYLEQCAGCHGESGEGVAPFGPVYPPSACLVTDCADLDEMIAYTETEMPLNNGDQCSGECAEKASQYIINGLDNVEEASSELSALIKSIEESTVHY